MTASTFSTRNRPRVQRSKPRRLTGGASRIGVRAVVVGAAVAVVAAGWPLPVGTTLVFGVAVLLWVLATMALEKPGTRP